MGDTSGCLEGVYDKSDEWGSSYWEAYIDGVLVAAGPDLRVIDAFYQASLAERAGLDTSRGDK